MTVRKKNKIRRWIFRILLFILLLPIGTLFIVRTAGLFKMRKPDAEIMEFLRQHQVEGKMDTLHFHSWPIITLRTTNGEKHKDAILLVHGSPGSMDAYLDYMIDSTLLKKADLITYDRPGFGHSAFGRSMPSLRMQTETTAMVMDKMGYDRYWLLGHSYGGPIVVEAAMEHAKHVAGISIVAGSVSPELEPSAGWRKWIDLPLVRNLLPHSMRVSNEELMPLKQDLIMIEDDWDKIHVPVSIIHGTKDVLVPFANLEYAKEKLVNAKRIQLKILEGKNHFILWTDKQVIIDELLLLMQDEK